MGELGARHVVHVYACALLYSAQATCIYAFHRWGLITQTLQVLRLFPSSFFMVASEQECPLCLPVSLLLSVCLSLSRKISVPEFYIQYVVHSARVVNQWRLGGGGCYRCTGFGAV